jgi:hypothetical protein
MIRRLSMANINLNGMEVELTLDELEELTERLSRKKHAITGDTGNAKDTDTWRWNSAAMDQVVDACYGKSLKILQVFVEHGRELKYKDLCKFVGLRGLHLVGPLSALRKKVKRAIGHDKAKLIEQRWVIPGNRDERIYYIEPEVYELLKSSLKG